MVEEAVSLYMTLKTSNKVNSIIIIVPKKFVQEANAPETETKWLLLLFS